MGKVFVLHKIRATCWTCGEVRASQNRELFGDLIMTYGLNLGAFGPLSYRPNCVKRILKQLIVWTSARYYFEVVLRIVCWTEDGRTIKNRRKIAYWIASSLVLFTEVYLDNQMMENEVGNIYGTRVADEKCLHENSWKNWDTCGREKFVAYNIKLDLKIQGVRP